MPKSIVKTVKIPDVAEYDVVLVLPSGENIVLQYRNEGDFPSLDVCFDKERTVLNWGVGMTPAKSPKKRPEEHECCQLWIGLDPNKRNYIWA
jgi:hypothetical protein